MAFVRENLTEKDKEFVASFQFHQPWSQYQLARIPTKWLCDRERKLYFICIGGRGYTFDKNYPPTYYYLIWDNMPVRVEIYEKGTGNNKKGHKIMFDIYGIIAPVELKVSGEEIVKIVKEVLIAKENEISSNILSLDFVSITNPVFCKEGVII